MAKHCVFYVIQYNANDGQGWYDSLGGVFRGMPKEAEGRFERAAAETPEEYSVRLLECRVLEQQNAQVSAAK